MTPTGPIAVCIGCYNQQQFLEGAIKSALSQTYPDIEIWVSDDASTDATGGLFDELRDRYPEVKFFKQPRNLGLAGNNSWLLAQPRTDYAVRLDSDDRLEPDYVATLSGLLTKYPEAGYAHCHSNQIDMAGTIARVRRLRPRPEYENAENALRKSSIGIQVAANNIMYRLKAVRDAGFFTAGMGMCEDWDLLAKIAANGWGNAYTPRVLANYRVWSDPQGARAKRKINEITNTIHVYEQTLEKAYLSRGWDTSELRRNRQLTAVAFTDALDSPWFSSSDRTAFKQLLLHLGDSLSLRLHIAAVGLGAGPLIRTKRRYAQKIKDAVKDVLDRKREGAH